jgi:hypothetical protein
MRKFDGALQILAQMGKVASERWQTRNDHIIKILMSAMIAQAQGLTQATFDLIAHNGRADLACDGKAKARPRFTLGSDVLRFCGRARSAL